MRLAYARRMSRTGAGKVFAGASRYRTDATRALVMRASRVEAARYSAGLLVLRMNELTARCSAFQID